MTTQFCMSFENKFKQNFMFTMRGQIIIFVFFSPTTFCVTSQFVESIQQYTCFKCFKLKQFFKLQSFMACIQFSAKLNFLNNFEHFAQRKSSNWNYVRNCRFKLYFQTNVVAYVEMWRCAYVCIGIFKDLLKENLKETKRIQLYFDSIYKTNTQTKKKMNEQKHIIET